MKRRLLILVAILIPFLGCNHEKTCEDGGNTAYVFPKLPADHPPMTNEQFDAFYQLPGQIKKCLSTPALIETCLTYPQIDLVFAWINLQTGYKHVDSIFNGFQELETRKDRAIALMDKYISMDPEAYDTTWSLVQIGHYTFSFVYIELMLGQYDFLNALSIDEKRGLLEECQKKYVIIKNDSTIYGVPAGTSLVCFIMARMMYNDNYKPLIDLYNSEEDCFSLVNYAQNLNQAVNESVYVLSQQYLLTVKN